MRENGDWQQGRVRICHACGATNPAAAAFCASCGSPIGTPEEQVIDVSSGEPHVIIPRDDPEQAAWRQWGSGGFEQGRVYVARGGRGGCLLVSIIGVLLFCCACWFLWNSVAWVF